MKRALATLAAGVLLVVASAMGPAGDVDRPITLGSKPGVGSGSNVVAVPIQAPEVRPV